MRSVIMAHREPGTPVVIGRNVFGPLSGPDEEVRVVRLADLNPGRGRYAVPADRRFLANAVLLRRFR